jgi:hypothetical protein
VPTISPAVTQPAPQLSSPIASAVSVSMLKLGQPHDHVRYAGFWIVSAPCRRRDFAVRNSSTRNCGDEIVARPQTQRNGGGSGRGNFEAVTRSGKALWEAR